MQFYLRSSVVSAFLSIDTYMNDILYLKYIPPPTLKIKTTCSQRYRYDTLGPDFKTPGHAATTAVKMQEATGSKFDPSNSCHRNSDEFALTTLVWFALRSFKLFLCLQSGNSRNYFKICFATELSSDDDDENVSLKSFSPCGLVTFEEEEVRAGTISPTSQCSTPKVNYTVMVSSHPLVAKRSCW